MLQAAPARIRQVLERIALFQQLDGLIVFFVGQSGNQLAVIGRRLDPDQRGDGPVDLLHNRLDRCCIGQSRHGSGSGIADLITGDGSGRHVTADTHRRAGIIAPELAQLPLARQHPKRIMDPESQGLREVHLPGTRFQMSGKLGIGRAYIGGIV